MTWVIIIVFLIIVVVYINKQNSNEKLKKKGVRNNELKRELKFNVFTDSAMNHADVNDSIKWELVRRKSARWKELGFGDGEKFPGYGKLYDREFMVWYCDVGTKEKKNVQSYKDRNPLNYEPKDHFKITGEGIYLERLDNTKEYESLYSGLDKKNRKRWYFALTNYTGTGIETDRELEKKEEIRIVAKPKHEVTFLDGWKLVERKSDEWYENGFGDKELFPGYGKIYLRTFDVWYCKIGSKDKNEQPEYKDKAILKFYNGIFGGYEQLKGKELTFESLSKTQGYIELITAIDNKERKRWYFGLKQTDPTYIYTTAAS